jgi:hypothetical protein
LIGVELPVSVIVIILVAVIVLLSITALYFSGWLSGAQSISIENAKTNACRRLSTNCYDEVSRVTLKSFDADQDGKFDPGTGIPVPGTDGCHNASSPAQDNLYMLCKCYYNTDENGCRDVCGCKGIAPISTSGPPEEP